MANNPNDKIVREWAERNGMEGFLIGDLRTALNDARSIPELAALQQAQQPSDSATEKLAAMLQGLEFQPVAATMPASVLGTACAAIAKQAKRAADYEAQQPSAQAVESYWCAINDCGTVEYGQSIGDVDCGESERRAVNDYINDQPNVGELHLRKLYTAPPPLPEGVSEEDVEAAAVASGLPVRFPNDRKRVVDALESYRARLAAKGGV